MRFGNNNSPPRFLSRKDQRRMIGMIILLGMVFLAIKATAQPSFWWWMFPDERPVAKKTLDEEKRREIDHSIPDERDLRPDEIVVGQGSDPVRETDNRTASPASSDTTDDSDSSDSGAITDGDSVSNAGAEGQQPVNDESDKIPEQARYGKIGVDTGKSDSDAANASETDAATSTPDKTSDVANGAAAPAGTSQSTNGSIPAIDWLGPPDLETATLPRDIFDSTLDRRVGIRRSEVATYYYILAKVRDIAPSVLEESVQPAADYLSMMTDPAQFRGRVIRLKGDATRIEPFSAARNPMGVDQLYDVWMFTRESGDSPIHVQVSSIPDGIPTGRELPTPVPVEVTGYFFRIEGYESVGGVYTAPLLLAGKLEWNRPAASSPAAGEDVSGYIWGFAGIIAGGVALILWRFQASDRRVAKSGIEKYMRGPEKAEGLDQFDTVNPADEFARMAAELEEGTQDP